VRSVLAQAEYNYRICPWDARGGPFRVHAYVPECDPIINEEFHEIERGPWSPAQGIDNIC